MNIFPLTLAKGAAFFNRKTELKHFARNIELGIHTLLASPRRYGKTSLVLKAIEASGLPYAHFDFLQAVNDDDIEHIMLKGIGRLMARMESGPNKLLKFANDFFAGLNIRLALDKAGLSVEFERQASKVQHRILDVLERIEKLALKKNQRIILFFDEFQRIAEISTDFSIESVIREVMQKSTHVSFIFSGSNRHLLDRMFNDRNRPFYKSCDGIHLQRIHKNEYLLHIKKAAYKRWGDKIQDSVVEEILSETKCHPYYVNLLCGALFRLDKIPKSKDVEICLLEIIEQERSKIFSEMDLLSGSQRKLLTMIARFSGVHQPRSHEFEMKTGMSGSTISQSLKFLEQRDYVFKDHNGHYHVLDPLFFKVLSEV